MQRAIQLAIHQASSRTGGPFGAVIVKDGQIIAEGASRVPGGSDPTAHAEIVAIRKACESLGTRDLSGCDLYASCEPCLMCFGAILWAKLNCVYYACSRSDAGSAGFDDAPLRKAFSSPDSDRSTPFVRLMATDGMAAFDSWRLISSVAVPEPADQPQCGCLVEEKNAAGERFELGVSTVR